MSKERTNLDDWADQHPQFFRKRAGANLAKPTPRKPKRVVEPVPLRNPELAGDTLTLWLPLPPEELHPNARVHFQNKARHAKNARNIAATIAALAGMSKPWEAAQIDATFYLGRVRDCDGLWTWIKNYIDGFQGIIFENDSRVRLGEIHQATGKASEGRREVEIRVSRLP